MECMTCTKALVHVASNSTTSDSCCPWVRYGHSVGTSWGLPGPPSPRILGMRTPFEAAVYISTSYCSDIKPRHMICDAMPVSFESFCQRFLRRTSQRMMRNSMWDGMMTWHIIFAVKARERRSFGLSKKEQIRLMVSRGWPAKEVEDMLDNRCIVRDDVVVEREERLHFWENYNIEEYLQDRCAQSRSSSRQLPVLGNILCNKLCTATAYPWFDVNRKHQVRTKWGNSLHAKTIIYFACSVSGFRNNHLKQAIWCCITECRCSMSSFFCLLNWNRLKMKARRMVSSPHWISFCMVCFYHLNRTICWTETL